MAGIGNCSEFQEITANSGITVVKSGTGSLTDPEVNFIGVNVSTDTENVLQVLADGSLFVDRCDVDSVCGAVNFFGGESFPVTTGKKIQIGMRFENGTGAGSSVPFDSASGVYELPRINPLVSTDWPLTCNIANGKPVYRANTSGGQGRLYVEPDKGLKSSAEFNATTTYSGVTYAVGAIYNQLQPTIATDDTCDRQLIMVCHYDFGGFEVQLQGNDQIIMNHQIRSPITNAWSTVNQTRAQASGPDNPSTIFMTVGQTSVTRRYAIPTTQATGIPGMRLQVNTVVGNPSVGTNVTSAQVRANRMNVYVHETA